MLISKKIMAASIAALGGVLAVGCGSSQSHNPNHLCRVHQGVRSVSVNNYGDNAVVCNDGVYFGDD